MSIALPRFRSDLKLVAKDVVEDPVFDRRVSLGGGGAILADLLKKPGMTAEALDDQLSIGPAKLLARLRHFAAYGLFEGPRISMSLQASRPPAAPPTTKPFVIRDDLRHACQACGSCCSATDVGPVPDAVADRILERDWSDDIPGLESNEDLFRTVEHNGESTRLTSMKQDQCVFLAPDKLCLIHRHIGFEAKPSPCRQFPYIFVDQGDGIAVSLQMECRAYWKARSAAGPTSGEVDSLQALLDNGAPVHKMDDVVLVDQALQIDRETYLALEGRIIEAVRAAEATGDVFAVMGAYARAVDTELTELYAPITKAESCLETARWRAAFPKGIAEGPSPESNFTLDLARFGEQFGEFSREASTVAADRGLSWLAQRLLLLNRAADAVVAIDTSAFEVRDPEVVAGTVADIIISSLFAKEPIRRSHSLRYGLALLGMRVMLTWASSCERAKSACRVEVFERDIIDSMVTISKMLRERAVLDCCNSLKPLIVSLFLTNLGVFARQSAPRLDTPGGIK
ncbi:MAG: Fe-S-cluster containining protein [Myxococcota bacterium]|jgi:Fe-S-cluster containining protein